MVKEAMIFQPPQKNTLTHLYATVEQKYLHPVYMVCRNADPSTMHRDGGWNRGVRIPGKAGDAWPVFFFADGHKDWCFEWLVFSGGKAWGGCGNCSMILVSRNKNTELV